MIQKRLQRKYGSGIRKMNNFRVILKGGKMNELYTITEAMWWECDTSTLLVFILTVGMCFLSGYVFGLKKLEREI